MSRIRMCSFTGVLLVFALVAGACGDSSGTSGTSASSKTPGSTLSAQARADFNKQLKEIKAEKATQFVGKVEGTDAFIGIEQRGDSVKAYICDSKQIAVWMAGKVSGDTLSASKGPVSMTGTVGSGGKQVTGSVTMPDGSKHAFTADLATVPAGLFQSYAVEGQAPIRAGWVVLASGEQRGAAKRGDVVQPTTRVSDELTVKLGGSIAPVMPPPGPVTDKASFCKVVSGLWHDFANYIDKRAAEGASKDELNGLFESLGEITMALASEGCDLSGLEM